MCTHAQCAHAHVHAHAHTRMHAYSHACTDMHAHIQSVPTGMLTSKQAHAHAHTVIGLVAAVAMAMAFSYQVGALLMAFPAAQGLPGPASWSHPTGSACPSLLSLDPTGSSRPCLSGAPCSPFSPQKE